MTSAIPAAAIAPQPPMATQDMVSPASQNLFEHVAGHARGLPQGANPTQLGQDVLQNLQGFFERSTSLTERAEKLTQRTPATNGTELVSLGPDGIGSGDVSNFGRAAPVERTQMDRVVESLGMMFDHSIETQMVVRGATQVSGAANTLLRGQ